MGNTLAAVPPVTSATTNVHATTSAARRHPWRLARTAMVETHGNASVLTSANTTMSVEDMKVVRSTTSSTST